MWSLNSYAAAACFPSPDCPAYNRLYRKFQSRGVGRAVVAAAKAQQRKRPAKSRQPVASPDSTGFGNRQSDAAASSSVPAPPQQQQQASSSAAPAAVSQPQQPSTASSGSSSTSASEPLPAASRGAVLGACTRVSLLLGVMGLGLHQLAPLVSPAALLEGQGEAVRQLLEWPPPPTLQQAGIALAAAAAATALRATTLAAWPAYREASDRSNTQVLSPLTTADVLYVSVLPGLAEELLFRGALLPAVAPDWRGALVAGLVFGALHSSGGRNAAFAAFASVLGCLYGGLMLATGSLWVPAIAHSAANVASAALWKAQHQQQPARK